MHTVLLSSQDLILRLTKKGERRKEKRRKGEEEKRRRGEEERIRK